MTSPSSSLSLAGQTLEGLARAETTPSSLLLSSPSLSFSPFSHFNQMDYKQKWSLKIKQHRYQTPILQKFNIQKAVLCQGTSLRVYPTAFAWSQLQKRERQWQRAQWRRPTALETQDKTTETGTRSSLATVYACRIPGGRFPAKFGYKPIKLELHLVVHTYPANCVRVHLRHLGVYKGSRAAYRATWVRVS